MRDEFVTTISKSTILGLGVLNNYLTEPSKYVSNHYSSILSHPYYQEHGICI